MANVILSNFGLSEGFWEETILTVCYILNRVPNKRNSIIPYELWNTRKSNLGYFRVWGCRAFLRVLKPKKRNLEERGIECIFIGYAEHRKAYMFIVIEPNASNMANTVIESIDAIFDENRFSSIPKPNYLTPSTMSLSNGEEQGDMVEMKKRFRKEKSFGSDFFVYLLEGTRDSIEIKFLMFIALTQILALLKKL